MEYTVNKSKYKKLKTFHYGKDKPKINFFISNKYFIKEYNTEDNNTSGPTSIIDFYTKYYNPTIFKAPKLIEYQLTSKSAKFVFENIGIENLKETLLKHEFNNNEARNILKSTLEVLLPLEKKGISHGDVRLHNLALKNNEVLLLDFDHFSTEKKDNFPLSITNFIYNYNNAYKTKKVVGLKYTADFKNIPLDKYHPCCQDIVKAIINGEASSIQEMLDLI